MKLTLKTPFDPGQNDATGAKYGTLFITQMTDNRTSYSFSFIYEAGDFREVTTQTTDGPVTNMVWVKGPGMLSQVATVAGDEYIAAITAPPLEATDTAYQSIIRLLYEKLIAAGFAGTIEDT